MGGDARVAFHTEDAAAFLTRATPASYDVVYADAWVGKFSQLEEALALVKVGGVYFVDDLVPQPSWPEEHAPKVPPLVAELTGQPGFVSTQLAWASGLMLLVRVE